MIWEEFDAWHSAVYLEGFIYVNDTKGGITGVGRIGIGALT